MGNREREAFSTNVSFIQTRKVASGVMVVKNGKYI
jgi:hypothetical protein